MKKWEFVTVRLMIFLRTIKEIRKGHIKIFEDIKCIDGRTTYFSDGKAEDFDAIVAATGYYSNYSSILKLERIKWMI